MSTVLQSSLNGLLTPDFVSQTADSLGEKGSSVSKAMSVIFPALIGSLGDHADDPGFMSSVYEQVAAPENDPGILSNPARLLGKAAMALPAMVLGSKFLKMMFGPKVEDLGHDVSGYAGVRDESAKSMLGIAAPLVLGALGRVVRAGNMNVAALARLLRGESREAHQLLPGALAHLERYSSIPPAPATAQVYQVGDRPVHYEHAEETRSKLWRWVVPLMLAAAAIWLLSTFLSRPGGPSDVVTAPATIDMEEMEIAAPPRPEPEPIRAAPVPEPDEETVDEPIEAEPEIEAGTATMDVELEADSTDLEVDVVNEVQPREAAPSRVVELEPQIIEGETPTTATIDPDPLEPGLPTIPVANVYFDDGSSALPSDVQVALLSVVTYMKANPGSTAVVSSYHSSKGDVTNNKKRSTERADAVRDELIDAGIAESRIRVLSPVEVTGAQPREERVQVRVRP